MQLDFEDVLASSIGRVMVIFLFFLSGIWLGSLVGGFALMVGARSLPDPEDVFMTPLLLVNVWIVLNVAFLAGMLIWIFVGDGLGCLAWGVLVGVESLFVMLGFTFGFGSPASVDTAIAWAVWLVVLVMLETGVWLVFQWRRSIWARQMAALGAENAMIRAQRDVEVSYPEPSEDVDGRN